MGTPFLGEIRTFSFSFPPKGWALCNGQLLSIQQNAALFSILGTTYGGNGATTFALPNLQGAMPIHFGGGIALGQRGGETAHTLTAAEYAHSHAVTGQAGARTVTAPANAVLASGDIFGLGPPTGSLASTALDTSGSGVAHTNMQPYLVISFCIALVGIFPSQN